MSTYIVRFNTAAEVTVRIEAPDEDTAADEAWEAASEYLQTLTPDAHGTYIDVNLDGIGADTVEVTP